MTTPDPDGAGPLTSLYTYDFDALNRLTGVRTPDPDGAGTVTRSITNYVYDVYSRLQSETDPLNKTVQYAYNDGHELVSLTDPNNNTTRWGYDRLGRTVVETNSLGHTRAWEYDAVGNVTRSTDRNRRITEFSHDALDRLFEEDWLSATTAEATSSTQTQGGPGVNEVQKVDVHNIQNGSFRLSFNGETTAPLAYNASAAAVDAALEGLFAIDNVSVSLTTATGVRTYTITFAGNLANTNVSQTTAAVRSGASSTTQRTINFGFDTASRLTSASDPSGSYSFAYDQLDRITNELQNFNSIGLTASISLDRTYDAVGNRLTQAADLISGSTVTADYVATWYYDDLDRISRIDQIQQGGAGSHAVADKRINIQYNALGQFTLINRFENLSGSNPGLRSVYTYDNANRLLELAHRNINGAGQANLLARYEFDYDAMNRILSIDSNLDGVSIFTYDKRSQLLTANHAAPRPDENYSFDSNGNRTNAGYSNGGNNQTLSDGVYNYTFDQEGNRSRRTRISDGSYEDYTWDHRNRLTRVTFKNSVGTTLRVVDYTNDVFNRLVQRVYDSNGPATGGVTTTYLVGYDGINPTLAFDGPNASDLTNRYLWGPAVDQLLADEQVTNPTVDGNIIWALADHLGSIRDLADFNSGTSNYTIVNHRVYDSFGRLTSETNGNINESFGYTGKYFDEVTGLSNHWHRWYDPQIGKWISQDPIGFGGGDANLGRYAGNAVTNSVDRLGLMQDPDGSEEIGERGAAGVLTFSLSHPEIYDEFVKKYGAEGIARLAKAFQWGYSLDFDQEAFWFGTWGVQSGAKIVVDTNESARRDAKVLGQALIAGMKDRPAGLFMPGLPALIRNPSNGESSVGDLGTNWQGTSVSEAFRNAHLGAEDLLKTIRDKMVEEGVMRASGPLTIAALMGMAKYARNGQKSAAAHAFHRLEHQSLQSQSKISELAASMKANGWKGDPISDFEHGGQKYILDGHHRVAAARQAGIDVPYRSIPEGDLPKFNYRDMNNVLNSASEAFGR